MVVSKLNIFLCTIIFKLKFMETNSINRAEIRGRIGQEPRFVNVGDSRIARFSVATSETYRDKSGAIREEVTWHNITAWESKNVDVSNIRKGVMVHLTGRIRHSKFVGSDGVDKFYDEIVATRLNVCDNNL